MADGRLTAELFEGEKPQEECGVFGVYAPGQPVAQLAYYGLYSLQHRGQESAGIAVSNGQAIRVYKDMGLVSQVFDDKSLATLDGHLGVGHVRYATTGRSSWENAQPTLGPTSFVAKGHAVPDRAEDIVDFGTVAVAHNGNLTNTTELMAEVRALSGNDLRGELGRGSSTDTAVMTSLLGCIHALSLTDAALELLPRLQGAFSLAFMDETRLYAARDRHGFRPLVLGRLPAGWAVASESAALDIIGADFEREVHPGELIAIDADGVHSHTWARPRRSGCIFEYVYLARPDTSIRGRSVNSSRLEMGRALAAEHPVDADLVIATPDSGTPAAIGYAQASGIPYGQGMVKNAYVGRTFIQPTQLSRQRGIRLKLNPLREVIEGKRLVVVDDSIVRGNTQRALVTMLRDAGAAEVHVRISSPPVTWPCFFGIDFPTRGELVANDMSVAEICRSIGADTLGYISMEGMVRATEQPRDTLCTACFTGKYPVDIASAAAAAGSDVFEAAAGNRDKQLEGKEDVEVTGAT
ncbi:MAG: amidophosphoribosyltransferase [Actinomycetaceae bacterium]|nr:amidophosphoribosyltransferase [Actinomycetaceae bacterium]